MRIRNMTVAAMMLAMPLAVSVAHAQDKWRVESGAVTLWFSDSLLKSHGIQLVNMRSTTNIDDECNENASAFRIRSNSSLLFKDKRGFFGNFISGDIRVEGGFAFKVGKTVMPMSDFRISSRGALDTDGLVMTNGSGRSALNFRIDHVMVIFDRNNREFIAGWADIALTKESASAVGHPELAGLTLGSITIRTQARPVDHDGEPITDDLRSPRPNPTPRASGDGITDLRLSTLGSLSAVGRSGTFPNGRNGFAYSTTSCNVGTDRIKWWTPNPGGTTPMWREHPVIAQQMYRVQNGRMVQIGQAWLKHGFLATNSTPGCVSGSSSPYSGPSGQSELGLNTTDTYATSNNSDYNYLGPRDEVNPFTGMWQRVGSFFDGTSYDGIRGSFTSGDGASRRCEVKDSDLQVSPATFIAEAYYINEFESNWWDNSRYRTFAPTWSGSIWTVGSLGAAQQAYAVDYLMSSAYASAGGDLYDMRSVGSPNTSGLALLLVNVTVPSAGRWKYEYALFNINMDRDLTSFSIPTLKGQTINNVFFRDIDNITPNAANDWVYSYDTANNRIKWTSPTGANFNPLKYGSLFNFSFETDVAPQDVSMTSVLENRIAAWGNPPTPQNQSTTNLPSLDFATRGTPDGFRYADSLTLDYGVQLSGTLASLLASDNNALEIELNENQEDPVPGQFQFTAVAPYTTSNRIDLSVEAKAEAPDREMVVEVFNWTTNDWVAFSSVPLADTDTVFNFSITSNASQYIKAANRQILTRISSRAGAADLPSLIKISVDQVRWDVWK